MYPELFEFDQADQFSEPSAPSTAAPGRVSPDFNNYRRDCFLGFSDESDAYVKDFASEQETGSSMSALSGDVDSLSLSSVTSSGYRARSHSLASITLRGHSFSLDDHLPASPPNLMAVSPSFSTEFSWSSTASTESVHISNVFDPPSTSFTNVDAKPRRSSMHNIGNHPRSDPVSPVRSRLSSVHDSVPGSSGTIESVPEKDDMSLLVECDGCCSEDENSLSLSMVHHRRHSVASGIFESLVCPWEGCGKTFTRRYNFDSHLRIHTGEKPFVCSHCDAAFARNHDLRRHERIHFPEREFVCPCCGKKFSRQDALRRHERSNSCSHGLPLSPNASRF